MKILCRVKEARHSQALHDSIKWNIQNQKFRDRTAYRLATVREREGETKCFMDMGFLFGGL